jgi:hypothetical protein
MHKIFGRTVFQSEGKAHITNISCNTRDQNIKWLTTLK